MAVSLLNLVVCHLEEADILIIITGLSVRVATWSCGALITLEINGHVAT